MRWEGFISRGKAALKLIVLSAFVLAYDKDCTGEFYCCSSSFSLLPA